MSKKRKNPKRRNPAAQSLANRRFRPQTVPSGRRYRRDRKVPLDDA